MLSGPTTFEGIANSLKLAKEAVATPASTGPPPSGQDSAQDAGPASKVCTDERQPDGNLESALSRLGGMLESAGPLTDQACSQLEVPAGQLLVSVLDAALSTTHLLLAYQRQDAAACAHVVLESVCKHFMRHLLFCSPSCNWAHCLSVSGTQSDLSASVNYFCGVCWCTVSWSCSERLRSWWYTGLAT